MNTNVCVIIVGVALWANAQAAVIVDFLGQGGIYDGSPSVEVDLHDGVSSTDFKMFVSADQSAAAAINLNSNAGGLGVDNDLIDYDGGESITISFNVDVTVDYIDFGSIGSDLTDAALLTIGGVSYQLYTGQPEFNGLQDIWDPLSPYQLNANDTIVLSALNVSGASFDLEGLSVTAVPEPSSTLLLGMGGLALLSRRKRTHRIRMLPNR